MTKKFGLYLFIIHFNIILPCTRVLFWLHCVASLSVGVHPVVLLSSPIDTNTKIWPILVFVPLANEIRAQSVSAIRAPARCVKPCSWVRKDGSICISGQVRRSGSLGLVQER